MAKKPKRVAVRKPAPRIDEITAYADAQSATFRAMCATLRVWIDSALPKATSKVWHGCPVWFIDDNPVVGCSTTAKSVNLMLWNGKAIDDHTLKPAGKYGAAQASFATPGDIDKRVLRGWLKKAGKNVFDSRTFFKTMREDRQSTRSIN